MKILLNLTLTLFLAVANAQPDAKTDIIEEISNHIKAGQVKELSAFFDVTVELTIQERENSYSKAQAEIILKNFFNKYPAKSFKVMHRGSSEKGGKYLIGLFVSENDTDFRTSIVLLEKNGQYYIQQLRFE
ncbi:MAG: DUF4783 domain-containing protein [Sphingobacteriaceae bacterium]|nr:DUF4783 domain-containing protein [Sphingobacteriaceae bacterium]